MPEPDHYDRADTIADYANEQAEADYWDSHEWEVPC